MKSFSRFVIKIKKQLVLQKLRNPHSTKNQKFLSSSNLYASVLTPKLFYSNKSTNKNMPTRPSFIALRHDQRFKDVESSQNPKITVFATGWVQEALDELGKSMAGIQFMVIDKEAKVIEEFQLKERISLVQLQKISRTESHNVTGIIDFLRYLPALADRKIILALRDLVRQTIIIGMDETTHYGGYPSTSPRCKQSAKVYIVDLSGLQFQQPYNTGRLVLVQENPEHIGLLDDLIFDNVVGKPRCKSFQEAAADQTGRFELTPWNVYFDILAYKKFVSQDVVLCALALNQVAHRDGESSVHFKFLKYGTGFFGGKYKHLLERHILSGVIDGLEVLFEKHFTNGISAIKHFEFPFFHEDQHNIRRLSQLKSRYGFDFSFSRDDALKVGPQVSGIVATTNCADPHAVTGNEMGFGSVDSVIAENIKSKGNIFSCCLNKVMGEEFIDL